MKFVANQNDTFFHILNLPYKSIKEQFLCIIYWQIFHALSTSFTRKIYWILFHCFNVHTKSLYIYFFVHFSAFSSLNLKQFINYVKQKLYDYCSRTYVVAELTASDIILIVSKFKWKTCSQSWGQWVSLLKNDIDSW